MVLAIQSPQSSGSVKAISNILITGASSGLGAALAEKYAAKGIRLILWGRDEQRLNATALRCRELGAIVEVDHFDLREIDLLISRLQVLDERTPVDLAIFNAGIGGELSAGVEVETPQRAHEIAMVNFAAPVVSATVLAQSMVQRKRGHIVLLGSVSERYPLPMAPTYAGTKAGLSMFAESLRLRLMKHSVAVTLVLPGFIDTPMSQQLHSPKPFLIKAATAAKTIERKIARRPARIVIPWQYAVLNMATRLVPKAIIGAVLRRF
jgi:short-subunit dehydrogenase